MGQISYVFRMRVIQMDVPETYLTRNPCPSYGEALHNLVASGLEKAHVKKAL